MGQYAKSAEDESFVPGHAFAEKRDNCPLDRMIREAGWEISDRPNKGEPIWRKRYGLSWIKKPQSQIIKELGGV